MLKNLFIFHRYKARIKGANVILFLRMIDSLGLLMEIQKNLFFFIPRTNSFVYQRPCSILDPPRCEKIENHSSYFVMQDYLP